MLAFPCDDYEDAKDIHNEMLAEYATDFWKGCAETEEEKRLADDYDAEEEKRLADDYESEEEQCLAHNSGENYF